MKTVKEAADSLLKKGEISIDDYKKLSKTDSFEKSAEQLKESGISSNIPASIRNNSFNILAGAAALMAGKELIFDPLKQSIQHKLSLDSIVDKVPSLEGKDADQIKEYFDVVKTFSPKAATNPLVAGALVNKMMEFGGVDHKLVQDISAIEKGLERPSIFQSATESAAKTIGGAGLLAT